MHAVAILFCPRRRVICLGCPNLSALHCCNHCLLAVTVAHDVQALWHGSLLAWLSAARLQPTPILGPQAEGAVTTEPVARPLFTWHGSSRQGSRGCELVQLLVSCTSVHTAHARCCAASFWAGYVGCIKTAMKQWCAGERLVGLEDDVLGLHSGRSNCCCILLPLCGCLITWYCQPCVFAPIHAPTHANTHMPPPPPHTHMG
jgi:hypothetical protein